MANHRQPPAPLRTYRPDIQGLRAVAIVMVVAWHTGVLNIHNGVVVSFVLSGFLIGRQLFNQIDKTGKVALGGFWARRFRRLAPGMAIVIISTIVLSWFFGSPLRFRDYASDGLYSAFSFLNWRLAENGTDYFANNGTQTPYQHFWSLGIEEQFYLVCPLLLVGAAWLSRRLFKNHALVAVLLVGVIGASLYLSIVQTQSNQPLAYFGTHTRAWELAAGVLLALGAHEFSRMNVVLAGVMSWVGLVMIVATGLLITNHTALPGYADAGSVLGAVLVIAGGCANPRFGAEWLLAKQLPSFLGNVSYGWYLWHWPLLILWPNIVDRDMVYADRIRIALLSLVLAAAMHYALERKVRARKSFVERPRRGITVFGGLTTLTAGVMGIALLAPLNLQTAPSTDTGVPRTVSLSSVQEATQQQDLPSNIQPTLIEAPEDSTHYGCIDDTDVEVFILHDNCIIGDTEATRTMVVLGDSHSWQWGDAFNTLGNQLGVRVVTIAKGGCSPGKYNILNDELGRAYTECDSWRESAFAVIDQLHPEVILVTSRIRREATEPGAVATFSRLQQTGAKLVYLTDTPHPGINIPDCLATHTQNVAVCNGEYGEVVEFPEARAMEQAVAQRFGAAVLDVLPAFCTGTTCPAIIGGHIVYFDDSHMTASYAEALVLFVEPTLRAVLP